MYQITCHRRLAAMILASILILGAPSLVFGTLVCFDPGHGGIDPGCATSIAGYYEKRVNLDVATALKDSLVAYGCIETEDYIFTRLTDTFVYLPDRCKLADSISLLPFNPLCHFVSIHHNSTSDTMTQGTEVFWDDFTATIPDTTFKYYGERRDGDSLLAVKVRLRINDVFGYRDRCKANQYCGDNTFWVLQHVFMPSCLSEASFISQPAEARKFYYDDGSHIEKEAGAIFHGWHSYYMRMGIGIVDNAYANWMPSDVTTVLVDFVPREVPYYATWEFAENHTLIASSFRLKNADYTFHHWQHYDYLSGWPDGPPWYNSVLNILVSAEFDYHYYVAFYKGGEYWVSLTTPWPAQAFPLGTQYEISIQPSIGAYGTNIVDLYLSRDSGKTYRPIIDSLPCNTAMSYWAVADTPASNRCVVKAVLRDAAENRAEGTTPLTFSIYKCGDANGDRFVNVGDAVYIMNYVYKGGPAPKPFQAADANCDGSVNVGDAVYIINYVFKSGPTPCCPPPMIKRVDSVMAEEDF